MDCTRNENVGNVDMTNKALILHLKRTVFCALKAGVGAKAAAEPTSRAVMAVLNFILLLRY
jgi:hypothetical protein